MNEEIIEDIKKRKAEAIKKARAYHILRESNQESYWLGMKDAMECILLLYGDKS